ncbi:hypothetical protein Fmac_028100 [Flemingia macrophylla]|uniref:Pectinesterase inhibitor domain-containing protein n=1 Tax=Flemingia macrophylla TaxID=520843 RepID=A0ABD1LJT2_9FABA
MDHLKITLAMTTLSWVLLSAAAVPSSLFFESINTSPSAAPIAAPVESKMSSLGGLIAHVAQQLSPEILSFCTGTENPSLCADTIGPYLDGTFDPVKALQSQINATLSKATDIAANISALLDDPATEAAALDALRICQSEYSSMVDTIKETVHLVEQQNVVDTYYKFSSVISYKSTCDDAFLESPGVHSPLADASDLLFQLGGNCLDIMNAIINNHRI